VTGAFCFFRFADPAQHRFTWSMQMQTIGADGKAMLVTDNYTSVVLTRRGNVSFDLLREQLDDSGKAFLNQIAEGLMVQPANATPTSIRAPTRQRITIYCP
jgi:uncharacterized membrane-anchored protein